MPIQRAPDLPDGMVNNGIANMLRKAGGGDDLNIYNGVPQTPVRPTFQPFQSGGPDPLQHVQSVMEQAVGSDPSLLGTIKAVAGAFSTAFGRPVATITDMLPSWLGGRLKQIEQMQKQFLADHNYDLTSLSDRLSEARQAMRGLSNLMSAFDPKTSQFDDIMKKKREEGRDLYQELLDALDNCDDPDEQQKLEAQKEQMDKWFKDCDDRVAKDQRQVDDLKSRTDKVFRVAHDQANAMSDAILADSPGNLTSDGVVVETTHTRPDAVQYVANLRTSLIQSRLQMNAAMAGQ
jgi:hypothetical protein